VLERVVGQFPVTALIGDLRGWNRRHKSRLKNKKKRGE
jgi:hypothetical protein